jgi:hypothetical protein
LYFHDDQARRKSAKNPSTTHTTTINMDKGFADKFAQEWIAAWNAHDVDRVLTHYTNDFEMTSPVITQVTGEPSGKLKGMARKDRE